MQQQEVRETASNHSIFQFDLTDPTAVGLFDDLVGLGEHSNSYPFGASSMEDANSIMRTNMVIGISLCSYTMT
jgi:hypothetical protein